MFRSIAQTPPQQHTHHVPPAVAPFIRGSPLPFRLSRGQEHHLGCRWAPLLTKAMLGAPSLSLLRSFLALRAPSLCSLPECRRVSKNPWLSTPVLWALSFSNFPTAWSPSRDLNAELYIVLHQCLHV